MRFAPVVFALAAVSSQLAACSGAPGDATASSDEEVRSKKSGAQMNDVSILFPLATSPTDFDAYLAANAQAANGVLFPQDVYESEFPPPNGPIPPGGDPGLPYETLRAMAVRFDPCFANIGPVTDPSSCLNQMRVIFQSISFDASSSSATALDGGVHVFFSLTRDELAAAIAEVIALRTAETSKDLGPLAIHPLMAREGVSGKFAQGLEAIVLKYGGRANFTRFTRFKGSNLDTVWNFAGFDVKNGKATPMVIPTLPSKATSESFTVGFGPMFAGEFTPATTGPDDMQLLANLANAQAASDAARQAAYDAALRIENPDFNSPNTTDCASCHLAEPARVLIAEKQLGMSSRGNANLFVADTSIKAADLALTAPVPAGQTNNLHAFSYDGTVAVINQRVVNETAAIVAYVNASVLGAN